MFKIKAFLVLTILVVFSFSLFGCDLLSGFISGEEEVLTGQDGELPEWLLLAHRSDERVITDSYDLDLPDDDGEVLAPPSPEQPATQPAPASSTPASTQPAVEDSSNDEPVFGTIEHIIWQRKQAELAKNEAKAAAAKKAAEEALESGKFWD